MSFSGHLSLCNRFNPPCLFCLPVADLIVASRKAGFQGNRWSVEGHGAYIYAGASYEGMWDAPDATPILLRALVPVGPKAGFGSREPRNLPSPSPLC